MTANAEMTLVEVSQRAVSSDTYRRFTPPCRQLPDSSRKRWLRLLTELLEKIDHRPRILEIGCGWGRFTALLASLPTRTPPDVVSMDVEPTMVATTREVVSHLAFGNVTVLTADIMRWTTGATFDLIFVSEVVHLIRAPRLFFHRVAELVDPAGVVAIRTPSHDQLERVEWLHYFPGLLDLDRARTPDINELTAMLEQAGIDITAQEVVDESSVVTADEYHRCLAARSYSILHLLDDDSLRVGLARLNSALAGSGQVRQHREMTLVVGKSKYVYPDDDIPRQRRSAMLTRDVVVKSLQNIPIEAAHGGSGARQVLLARDGSFSPHLEAFTKGFLEPGSIFDWHDHDVDEFFIVLHGVGSVHYEQNGDTIVRPYQTGDLYYCPAGVRHKIACDGTETSEYFFIRVDS
jgi:quercetin dioxygenase-like cupin family protein/cyclopropane fatty-acyl-phospholipid synthase-like methyltransferase